MKLKNGMMLGLLVLCTSVFAQGYGTTVEQHDAFASWYLTRYADRELMPFVLQKMDSNSKRIDGCLYFISTELNMGILFGEYSIDPRIHPQNRRLDFGFGAIPFGIGSLTLSCFVPATQLLVGILRGGFDEDHLGNIDFGITDASIIGDNVLFAPGETDLADVTDCRYYIRDDLLTIEGSLLLNSLLDLDFSYRDTVVRGGDLSMTTSWSVKEF